MRRFIQFFMIIGVLSLLLSACGTSGSENTTDTANNSEPAKEQDMQVETNDNHIEKDDKTNEPSQKNELEQNKSEAGNNNNGITEDQLPNDQKLVYTLNGEEKEETAVFTNSENQDFSIYILPAYELTAEEPYKDSLFLKENDHVFMRIELLSPNTDITSLKENTTAQLKVVNEDVKNIAPPADDMLKDATVLEASKDGEIVTAYLIKQEEAIVKLTLFTTEQSDHRDALLQMAKTIKAGKAVE
ncbi:hypothetical protein [Niallia oryzisoli]|uniref:hypothetical protein n=1 Tax=Niallia oryzisoli TaxID=1737571 RepID=UPI003735A31C